jgi:hypothetical protein
MNHTLKVILDEGPRPKGGKLKQYPRGTYFGRKINWFRPKNSVKRRTFDLDQGMSNLRIQCASNQSKLVPRKLDLDHHLKWPLIKHLNGCKVKVVMVMFKNFEPHHAKWLHFINTFILLIMT